MVSWEQTGGQCSVRHKLEIMVCGVRCYWPKTLLMLLILETGTIVIGYVFCEYRLYIHILHCADIPQLPSIPTVNSPAPPQSWCHEHAPTLVSSISYTPACQLICGSSSVQQTDTVTGSLTEHTITSIAPILHGSTCTANVTACCIW